MDAYGELSHPLGMMTTSSGGLSRRLFVGPTKPLSRAKPLSGRDLRHASIAVLSRGGPLSIGELLGVFESAGFTVAGGAASNKVLSDALRWEHRRGRLRRVGRGVYAVGQVARTTLWRVRQRWTGAREQPTGTEVVWQPRPLTDADRQRRLRRVRGQVTAYPGRWRHAGALRFVNHSP